MAGPCLRMDGVERTLCADPPGLCLWMVGWVLTPAASGFLPSVSHDPGWFLGMMDGLFRTDLALRHVSQSLVWAEPP